jgi:hypothetical protein
MSEDKACYYGFHQLKILSCRKCPYRLACEKAARLE